MSDGVHMSDRVAVISLAITCRGKEANPLSLVPFDVFHELML